ncbi:MAG: SDR family oxidoreductase [Blastocatellia bacterium]|jgi:3-oxoacyl-[acyl-carrier protein] reductase
MGQPAAERRTFFLTGCASGIGRHLADRLAREGHQLMATDIREEALAEVAETSAWPRERCRWRRLDVRDPRDWSAAVAEAVEAFGSIDVLMNIAGYMQSEWIQESTVETVDRHVDINLKGVIHGTRVAANQMARQGQGHIINIASLSGVAPIPGIAVYSATKFACRAFSLAAALELREQGIFVTAVSPDAVETPLLAPQKGVDAAAILFSGSRLLRVEEIADLILGRVLRERPLEVTLPRYRGWLAHLTNLFPAMGFALGPAFRRVGGRRQTAFFHDRSS